LCFVVARLAIFSENTVNKAIREVMKLEIYQVEALLSPHCKQHSEPMMPQADTEADFDNQNTQAGSARL